MSIKIMNEAWETRGLDPTTKLILMCLADHANEDDRTCWPAIDTIARKCDVSRSTVKRRLAKLEKLNHISRRNRTGDSMLYFILPNSGTIRGAVQPEPSPHLNRGQSTSEPGGGSLLNHKPSLNHQEPSVNNNATPRSELERVLRPEIAEALLEHRIAKRAKLTTHAAKLLAGKFAQCPDANAAADAMIANGWQGFEVSWMENRNQPSQQKLSPLNEAGARWLNGQSSESRNSGNVEFLPAVGQAKR